MKRITVVNAGPRSGWNTDQLICAASQGAESAGAETRRYDLYRLERFTGCVSCFACKRKESYGICACRDALYPVLDTIRHSDGLIIGSPNYLGNLSSGFRALYERLVFQNLTYNRERPCASDRRIPVLLITTSNVADNMYNAVGYTAMLKGYRDTLERFIGPVSLLICGDTLQVSDYGRYQWTIFDPEAKKKHREETFSDYVARAREAGVQLAACEG